MPNIQQTLTKKFEEALQKAYPHLENPLVEIVQSTNPKFGHYQFNSAMKLAKPLGKNPREVSQSILSALDKDPLIDAVELAGPGFINIHIKKKFIAKQLSHLIASPRLGIDPPPKKERIIVEFSSPNIAKELHVGHLRSTIIGDSLARLLEFLGHDVLRLNHIGDFGTQFGMLIAYMKEVCPTILSGKKTTDLSELVTFYKASKERFDRDADFKKRAQLEVVKLQSGEKESVDAWQLLCTISRKAFEEIYRLLDINIIERGESFYKPMLADTIKELEQKGLVQISDGAKCIFVPGFVNREGEPLPLMLQKTDGGFGYDTTDIAAVKHRIFEEKADRIIYVTDAGQSTHFHMFFKAAEMAGWADPQKVQLDHVPFGLVLGQDGKKFKTRSGDTEKLIDLLLEACQKAKTLLKEKNPNMGEADLDRLAESLGIGAVKYADLSCNRTGDYTFSYERMLRFEGNTCAYLMYVYVRILGIERKVPCKENSAIELSHPTELDLALHLLQFDEAIRQVEKDLLPNRLTDYLFGLAEKFNAFYRDCQVEGSKEQDSRIELVKATGLVMKTGLSLLGITAVEKM